MASPPVPAFEPFVPIRLTLLPPADTLESMSAGRPWGSRFLPRGLLFVVVMLVIAIALSCSAIAGKRPRVSGESAAPLTERAHTP